MYSCMGKLAVSNGDLEIMHCAAHGSDYVAKKDLGSNQMLNHLE